MADLLDPALVRGPAADGVLSGGARRSARMVDTSGDTRGEYDGLAADYDQRWARYVAATNRALLGALDDELPGRRLLDVGCGSGALLAALAARYPPLGLAGVDLSPVMLAVAKRRLPEARLVHADAGRLPFATDAFDTVVSASSLHYWPEPERALAEIARVLRPNGRIVLCDWDGGALRIRLMERWLRLTRRPIHAVYDADALTSLLLDAGFERPRIARFGAGAAWPMLLADARHPAAPEYPSRSV